MNYGKGFRRSLFGGFRRKDVLRCFDALSEENADRVASLNDQIAGLESQLSQEEEELASSAAERDDLSLRLREAIAEAEELRDLTASQKDRLAGLEEDRARYEAETAELRRTVAAYEEKSREYDRISGEIDGMMAEARRSAEQIIRQAESRSRLITGQGDSLGELSHNLSLFLRQLGAIRDNVRFLADDVESRISSMETVLSGAGEKTADAPAPAYTPAPGIASPVSESPSASGISSAEKPAVRKDPVRREPPQRGLIDRLMELIGKD